MPSEKPVRISKPGQIVVVDKVVQVRKQGTTQEDVAWNAQDDGGPWLIRFAAAEPFSEREYTVPKGGKVSTVDPGPPPVNGPVNGVLGRSYSYEVVDPSTGQTKDVGVVKVVASLAKTDDEAIEGVLASLADVDDPAAANVVASLTAVKTALRAV
jgi:hypothetical protein